MSPDKINPSGSNEKEGLTLKVIARIHTDLPTKFGVPRQSGLVEALKSIIVFEPEYRNPDALQGLEDYSHIWLIWEFSEAVRENWSPTVRPPRLGGNTRMGVFATRSPFRPNPLALSSVRLDKIEIKDPAQTPLIAEDYVGATYVDAGGNGVQEWALFSVGDVIVSVLHSGPTRPEPPFMNDVIGNVLARIDPTDFAPGGIAPSTTVDSTGAGSGTVDSGSADETGGNDGTDAGSDSGSDSTATTAPPAPATTAAAPTTVAPTTAPRATTNATTTAPRVPTTSIVTGRRG